MEGKVKKDLKRGSRDWWTALALYEAANRYRQRNKLPAVSPVEIDLAKVNAIIDEWNRRPLKRLWLFLTNGDVKELDLGEEVKLKY